MRKLLKPKITTKEASNADECASTDSKVKIDSVLSCTSESSFNYNANSFKIDPKVVDVIRKQKSVTSTTPNQMFNHQMKKLFRKLFILLIWNVSLSGIALVTLMPFLTYSAVCIDMMISNICLWLSFGYNQPYFDKFCKPCVNLSRIHKSISLCTQR